MVTLKNEQEIDWLPILSYNHQYCLITGKDQIQLLILVGPFVNG